MVTIIFEAHGTTFDNESGRASGWDDVELSPLGEEQAAELGARYADREIAAVFCSDLARSYRTAQIAFHHKLPIIEDARLRECDYGEWTGRPSAEVETEKGNRVTKSFPRGESYAGATRRIRDALLDMRGNYAGKTVLIIGHRATQYGLEYLLKGVPLEEAVTAPWQWQPGWEYELK